MRALVMGDGPSYQLVSGLPWARFDGELSVATHTWRHSVTAVVSIDPRRFSEKEQKAVGRSRVVIALSKWANAINLKRHVPRDFWGQVEWGWCDEPILTSGVFAILWAAAQGATEIYTVGVDLHSGYHNTLDKSRHLLRACINDLTSQGIRVYKRCPSSTLPVPVSDPIQFLPPGTAAPPVPRPAAPAQQLNSPPNIRGKRVMGLSAKKQKVMMIRQRLRTAKSSSANWNAQQKTWPLSSDGASALAPRKRGPEGPTKPNGARLRS